MIKHFIAFGSYMVALALLTGCSNTEGPARAIANPVKLPIPDRQWDPQRPDPTVGWCAEACIQMAMGYYGDEVAQQTINAAGKPRHPDLYAGDIDPALDRLGVKFVRYQSAGKVSAFIEWIQQQLQSGRPVLCGCKIYPDEHPYWSLDHFVLAVGFDAEGLWLNTQLDLNGQTLVSYAQLRSRRTGYSLENRQHQYFGRAILGLNKNAPQ